MKRYKWVFLILVSGVIYSCKGTSEEELVGDWQRRQGVHGSGRCHAATFIIAEKGYLISGYNGSNVLLSEVQEFDPEASDKGVWKEMPDLPNEIPARQQAIGFSVRGKGYIGTGWSFALNADKDSTLRDFWQFDPTKYDRDNNVYKEGAWEEVAPLPVGKNRRGAIAFSLKINGEEFGFVGCGYTGEPKRVSLQDFWMFDPTGTTIDGGKTYKGEWTPLDGYGGGKRAGASVFVIDNKAYICVGEHNSNNITDFWMFDPNASGNKWVQLMQMADANKDEDYDDDYGSLRRAYGAAFVAKVSGESRGHIVCGKLISSATSTNWEYNHNPVNENGDLWAQRTQFYNHMSGNGREGMISFSFASGRAFVGLGKSGANYYADDLWEFIPLIEDYTYNDYE